MAVSGDFMRLALLRERLQRMAQGEARKAAIAAIRDETQKQVVACFIEKRDPYGRAWKPRKPPALWAVRAFGLMQQTHALLDKTGALLDSVRTVATAIGVRATMLGYGVYHWQPDRPGEVLPQRAMLPTERQGLGPIWGDAFLRATRAVAKEFLGSI